MQRGGEFMTIAMTKQEGNPGGSTGNMDIACEADEYVGEDGLVYCSTCHTPRQTRKMLFGKERILSVLFRCRQEERDRLEEERRQREFRQEISRMKADGLQDKALYDYCFEKDRKENPQMRHAYTYVDRWEEMWEKGRGLLIWGPVGSGKSFMAGCIANALLDRRIRVLATNFSKILNSLTGMFGEDRNTYINGFNHYALLVIDDLGIERKTDFALEQIFNVIDSRYRSKKPMIVCTNLELDELKNPPDLEHERIYDRILERCIPIRSCNRNFRMENAMRNMREAAEIFV